MSLLLPPEFSNLPSCRSFLRSLLSFASPPQLEFRLTAADLPDFEAQAKLDLQHPLKRRQSLTGILSDSLPTSLRLFNSLLYTSRYFTTNSLSLLFSSLPLSSLQSVDHFTLSFATYHHGYSLHSLYKLTAHYSPTILLLRSLESKVVIGVYLDDTISPPGNQMRGKGKGGVFRLDEQKCIWYGTATEKLRKENEKEYCELQRRRLSIDEVSEIQTTETEDENSKLSAEMTSVATDGEKVPRLQVDPNDMDDIYYQYCISQLDALIFGGSAEHGTNAIRICSDLRTCSAGPSDTYQNLPLVPEESDPFLIGQFNPHSLLLSSPSLTFTLSTRGCGSVLRSHGNGRFH
jgi:hypothetical protein